MANAGLLVSTNRGLVACATGRLYLPSGLGHDGPGSVKKRRRTSGFCQLGMPWRPTERGSSPLKKTGSDDFYTERVSYRRSPWLGTTRSGDFLTNPWLRRLLLAAPLVTIASLLMASPALAATGLNPLLPNAVSPNGHNLYVLYNWISAAALGVLLLIEVLLLTIVIRDRRKRHGPDYRPPQTHGNPRLEIAWTLAPAVLIAVIGYFSFNELQNDFLVSGDTIAANQGPTDLAITVTGYQFGWAFAYPDGFTVKTSGFNAVDNPMVVPTGALVRLKLESIDVIHGFWVPEISGKTDAVPGYTNYAWFKISQPGEFRGECTELCGVGHGTMQIRVKAVSPDEYNAWVAEQVARAKATPTPSPSAKPSAAATPGASPSPSAGATPSPNPSPSGSARPSPSPSSP